MEPSKQYQVRMHAQKGGGKSIQYYETRSEKMTGVQTKPEPKAKPEPKPKLEPKEGGGGGGGGGCTSSGGTKRDPDEELEFTITIKKSKK